MNPGDLVTRINSFLYALRRGQMEKVLALLAIGLFSASAFVPKEATQRLPYLNLIAYGLSAACGIWLVVRLWKQAVPPPEEPEAPASDAIKGLLPFTINDGKLFAQMGRKNEIQSLVGLARNEQVGVVAVRGESGAGKTSLLQAGVAYTLGKDGSVYWEAVPNKPAQALLYAINSQCFVAVILGRFCAAMSGSWKGRPRPEKPSISKAACDSAGYSVSVWYSPSARSPEVRTADISPWIILSSGKNSRVPPSVHRFSTRSMTWTNW